MAVNRGCGSSQSHWCSLCHQNRCVSVLVCDLLDSVIRGGWSFRKDTVVVWCRLRYILALRDHGEAECCYSTISDEGRFQSFDSRR
jgi:hypothetical protein